MGKNFNKLQIHSSSKFHAAFFKNTNDIQKMWQQHCRLKFVILKIQIHD